MSKTKLAVRLASDPKTSGCARLTTENEPMSFRPQIAADPADAPRASAAIKTVAEVFAAHPGQARRLVQSW
jgi:hypothetical protein